EKPEEKATEPKEQAKETQKAEPQEEESQEITFDDFSKIDLRVGKIIACERLEKSDKLLKSTIFDGERNRTILSGIAQWYTPEDMVGKNVVIVANLAPRKMRGVMSEGMIIASDKGDAAEVLFVSSSVEPGSKVR
ncbi:MAG: methionine--tRNA ligase subunit beta, partial [Oscillospiraceae bacterium]